MFYFHLFENKKIVEKFPRWTTGRLRSISAFAFSLILNVFLFSFVIEQRVSSLFFVFFQICFIAGMSNKHLLFDVSSVVGAPWRCGVLTTQGGKAGIGLAHLPGRQHSMTQLSRVGWRLLAAHAHRPERQRSVPRLDYCRSEEWKPRRMTKSSCACDCGRGPDSVGAFFFLSFFFLLLSTQNRAFKLRFFCEQTVFFWEGPGKGEGKRMKKKKKKKTEQKKNEKKRKNEKMLKKWNGKTKEKLKKRKGTPHSYPQLRRVRYCWYDPCSDHHQ